LLAKRKLDLACIERKRKHNS
jgi:hypothetical protein